MEVPALLSLHLKNIEQELRSEIAKYEKSEFTSQVNDLLNSVDFAYAKREHSFQRALETKWDESEYLLQATYQYRLAIDWLNRGGDWSDKEYGDIRIDNAFQWMIRTRFIWRLSLSYPIPAIPKSWPPYVASAVCCKSTQRKAKHERSETTARPCRTRHAAHQSPRLAWPPALVDELHALIGLGLGYRFLVKFNCFHFKSSSVGCPSAKLRRAWITV